jgi:hypothetical protein
MSADKKIALTIPTGTTVLAGTTPPVQITITPDSAPPAPPVQKNVIGIAYECLPNGTTFNPPIPITWQYDPATLPLGTDQSTLQVAFYNESTKTWEPVKGIVDTVNHTIRADIAHFSVYAVMSQSVAASPKPAAPPAATAPPTTALNSTPAPSQPASSSAAATPKSEAAPFNAGLLIWIIVLVIVVILVIVLFTRRKKSPKDHKSAD